MICCKAFLSDDYSYKVSNSCNFCDAVIAVPFGLGALYLDAHR